MTAAEALDAVNAVIRVWPVTEGPLAPVVEFLTPAPVVEDAPVSSKKATIKTVAPTE